MNKIFALALVALSLAVSGLCYAAWRPVTPAVVEALSRPEAPRPAPVVLETSAVLVLAEPAKEAPKYRPAPPKAKKTWQCEDYPLLAGYKARAANPASVHSCGWR